MLIPEKGLFYRASRRAYVGNYAVAILFLIFFLLVYQRFQLSFTLLPLTPDQAVSSLVVLGFLAVVSFLFEEPVFEGIVRHYIVTNHEVVKVEGILRKKRIVIPYGSVADVSIKKSVFGRIFNYGDLVIMGFKEPIIMKALINPELIQRIIQNKISLFRRRMPAFQKAKKEE